MLKPFVFLLAAVSVVHGNCPETIKCFDYNINKKINDQIGVELTGHYTYLNLAQKFEHHTSYYPKIAKYLRAKSAEELTHAERFIEYQNQRGGTVEMKPVSQYVDGSCANVDSALAALKCAMELEAHVTRQLTTLYHDSSNIKKAHSTDCGTTPIADDDLRLTQPMLFTCTQSGSVDEIITSTYSACDCSLITNVAYVELGEMIAHEFLDHQVEDTKEIASYYHSLKKMRHHHEGLGDYLFDQHLEL